MRDPMGDHPVPSHDDTSRIDATFRNGSITTVGIILGFSLGFVSQWASNPIAWSPVDIVAALPIIGGIAFQGKALADLLSPSCLALATYDRAKTTFLIGLTLVAAGVAAAILLDVFGLGPRSLRL